MSENPNRGRRKLSYGSRPPRLSDGRKARVTTTAVDPAYLARYGTESAIGAAERNDRKRTATGAACTLARNAPRTHLRASLVDRVLRSAERAEERGNFALAASLLTRAVDLESLAA